VATVGKLDRMTLTVYVPENRYGLVNVGDRAEVQVDSFPGEVFGAEVVRIADEAEFTPRNV
jgi:HlyD family secretion protein